jgi:stage V sporulation protein AC
MNMDKKTYRRFADAHAPHSPMTKNCLFAFLCGGGICTLGQALRQGYETFLHMPEEDAALLTSMTLILLAVVLTAFGVFDRIAKFAGAGTLVPITGFANSMVASAIEYKKEGPVLGVGSKMFSVAGPVLVCGISAATIIGIIYWILG